MQCSTLVIMLPNCSRYSNLQLGIAKDGEDVFELPVASPDYGKQVAAYYFFVFPNMMFNFYPGDWSINIVKPLSQQQCKVSFLTYVWKEELFNRGAGSDLNQVEMEDEEVVEAVQKGIRSRFYNHGRYSVTREQGTHHFQDYFGVDDEHGGGGGVSSEWRVGNGRVVSSERRVGK